MASLLMHICVSELTIIVWDNGLSPSRRQAIILANGESLLIGPLGTKFCELKQDSYIFVNENAFENVDYEMAVILCRPRCVITSGDLKILWNIHLVREGKVQNKSREASFKHRCAPLQNISRNSNKIHDDAIKWKHFLRYWPLVRESTGHRWIPLTKVSDAELW